MMVLILELDTPSPGYAYVVQAVHMEVFDLDSEADRTCISHDGARMGVNVVKSMAHQVVSNATAHANMCIRPNLRCPACYNSMSKCKQDVKMLNLQLSDVILRWYANLQVGGEAKTT
jgi:hypothetical protein